ncbi:MAG TPA: PQQ-like beta-propeller repeat protein [Phycisphaerae bacterium]|nr:PQQ-like beta-propeller repeat protein [Phycisphaerae bacterium]HRW53630.1 PQQ-like beta-propeller repeat protein [Phycisphaerae bacterium]
MLSQLTCVLVAFLAAGDATPTSTAQFGGPKQDFKVRARGLADSWPESGPKSLWERDLGVGYSGVIASQGALYTMYREGGNEVVICIDAKDGRTRWEFKYDAPIAEKHEHTFNDGPRATPLLYDGKLYTIGCNGKMYCLDPSSGDVRWFHDLWRDFDGSFLNHGYSSSPFGYKDTVIAMVGGEGHALVAFDMETGKVKWKRLDYTNSYSTPKLINVDGQDQLLCYMAKELVGVDPNDGTELWKYEIGNQWRQNITLPLWGPDHILFISTNEAGSRGLKLTQSGGKTKVEELWSNGKVKVHHSNAVRIGDHVYTSTGGLGSPGVFWAIDVKTGEVAWKERGFDKATCIYADGRFIVLDESGNLGLVTATPEMFRVHNKVAVLEPVGNSRTWTGPTLDGTTLYLRDTKKIKALDLSAGSEPGR